MRVLAILLMALLPTVGQAKVNTTEEAVEEAFLAWVMGPSVDVTFMLFGKCPGAGPHALRAGQRFHDTFDGSIEAIEGYLEEFWEPSYFKDTDWPSAKAETNEILEAEIAALDDTPCTKEDEADVAQMIEISDRFSTPGPSIFPAEMLSEEDPDEIFMFDAASALLLSFHPAYQQNPAAELADGWVQRVEDGDSFSHVDIDFDITLPVSWAESNAYNEYPTWQSQNGYGYESLSLAIYEDRRNPADPPVTAGYLQLFLDAGGLPYTLPDDATLQSTSVVTLNNLPAMRISYREGDTRSTDYAVFYGTTLFAIKTSVYDDTGELEARKAMFDPLFDKIAKSLVLSPTSAE